jgi:hypothetical protein
MKKYIFTKSMKRHERCALAYKLYEELLYNGNFEMIFASLEHELAQKKRKRLYGNKSIAEFHVIKAIRHRGVIVYNIITKNKGIDVVFDSSPKDSAEVEYIRISPSGKAIVYTQHLLDRYNERICNDKFTKHKDIMIELFVQNPNKADIALDKDKQAVQRIEDGFLLGKLDTTHNCIIFNTFYDSEEYRDNGIKNDARKAKQFHNNLSQEQKDEHDTLLFLWHRGLISKEYFENYAKNKGLL